MMTSPPAMVFEYQLSVYFFHFLIFVMNCLDIDECFESVDDCDINYGNCSNTIGSFTCACVSGFSGDGTNCSSKTSFLHSFCFTYIFISQILMSVK